MNGKDAKVRVVQKHVTPSREPITRSRAKQFQKKFELFIGETLAHLEELEFKVKELKSKLIILFVCLEAHDQNAT